jgi:16S rRNA (cytosine1402-N4)-methyltransferase
MLQECVEALAIKPNGVYVDLTFGGGGHSAEILRYLDGGKLFAFDQDEDARVNAVPLEQEGMIFIAANFRYFQKYLKMYGVEKVDGILADLGVSSHQIDAPERGFSTRFNAKLDMRMDRSAKISASNILNNYTAEELMLVFSRYGEVRNARTLANNIVSTRTSEPVETIDQLKSILKRFARRGRENKYYAQVFQALRIEVNNEMTALEEMLVQGCQLLKPGGRFVVLSYHSLEDRLVKNYFNKGKFSGEVEKDFYGNLMRPLEPVNRKPIVAGAAELQMNNRARSAKLRVAKKL